jgi:hypothetical protein
MKAPSHLPTIPARHHESTREEELAADLEPTSPEVRRTTGHLDLRAILRLLPPLHLITSR